MGGTGEVKIVHLRTSLPSRPGGPHTARGMCEHIQLGGGLISVTRATEYESSQSAMCSSRRRRRDYDVTSSVVQWKIEREIAAEG